MKRRIGSRIVAALLLAGCQQQSAQAPAVPKSSQVTEEVAAMRAELDSLKRHVDGLREDQRFQVFRDRIREVALLKPGAAGYSIVQTDLGALLVSLEDVRAYANGTRVTLEIGNATSASISGLSARVDWAPADKDGGFDNAAASGKNVNFVAAARPGAWTRYEVVLDGMPPEKLAFIRLSDFKHQSVNLARPR